MTISCCVVCGEAFKEGDKLQAFLRCPEDPLGSWTKPYLVDKDYQKRSEENKAKGNVDRVRRKHKDCQVN